MMMKLNIPPILHLRKKDAALMELHLKLTAVCTAITGLILLVLTAGCLSISRSEIRSQEFSSFLTSLDTLYQTLEQQSCLAHSWIRQAEYSNGFLIRLSDNGNPLFFQSLESDSSSDPIFSEAKTQALSLGVDLDSISYSGKLSRHEEFTLDTVSGEYYASAAILPRSGGVLSAIVLHPLSAMEARIKRQSLLFLAADCFALLAFTVFFLVFSRQNAEAD